MYAAKEYYEFIRGYFFLAAFSVFFPRIDTQKFLLAYDRKKEKREGGYENSFCGAGSASEVSGKLRE